MRLARVSYKNGQHHERWFKYEEEGRYVLAARETKIIMRGFSEEPVQSKRTLLKTRELEKRQFKTAIMGFYDESAGHQQLSEWFKKARTEYKQKIGNNRLTALKRKDPRNPLLGSVSLLAPLTLGLREVAHTSALA